MCDLTGIGTEYQGVHPCIVLSIDIKNESSSNVIVAVITHQEKKRQPTHYYLYKEKYDFFKYPKNTVLCEEIKTIDKRRLEGKMGYISWNDFYYVLDRMKYNFESFCGNFNK